MLARSAPESKKLACAVRQGSAEGLGSGVVLEGADDLVKRNGLHRPTILDGSNLSVIVTISTLSCSAKFA